MRTSYPTVLATTCRTDITYNKYLLSNRTNVLDRYFNKDFTLTLPDNKKITEIKWLAVYDLSSQNTFGDIYIPEEFEPPTAQKVSRLVGRSHDVNTENIEIIDAKTIKISQFTYNGQGKGENLPYICLVHGIIKIDSFVQSMSSSVVYRYSDK